MRGLTSLAVGVASSFQKVGELNSAWSSFTWTVIFLGLWWYYTYLSVHGKKSLCPSQTRYMVTSSCTRGQLLYLKAADLIFLLKPVSQTEYHRLLEYHRLPGYHRLPEYHRFLEYHRLLSVTGSWSITGSCVSQVPKYHRLLE